MTDSLVLSPTPEDCAVYAGKTFSERLTGRFYTPDIIGRELARRVCDLLERRIQQRGAPACIKVSDPFCGDGRLIIALLMESAVRDVLSELIWVITVRDIDRKAVKSAAAGISEVASRLSIQAKARCIVGSTFTAKLEQHDVVITNPPWEQLKPDARELRHMSANERDAHRQQLRSLSKELDSRFPEAHAAKAWAGWGTNLARCGWACALRSCAPNGILGIVLPAAVLADQASATMRQAAFSSSRLVDLASYPAEARLFSRVDQPVVAATFVAGVQQRGIDAYFQTFDGKCQSVSRSKFKLSSAELVSQDYSLPIGHAPNASTILAQLKDFPCLSELEGDGASALWSGRELDETRISEKLVGGKKYPFLKGRMIKRHGLAESPQYSVRQDLACRFKSVSYERVVWRDVSRASQVRRMIGSIVPPGWVTGNSLHVAHFRDGDPRKLRALHAVLSSLVFEFQMRSRLATGHMSLGVVRAARVPAFNDKIVRNLAAAAEWAIAGGHDVCMEVAVAKAYGFNRGGMEQVISHFPKIAPEQREALLGRTVWAHRFTR